MTNDNSIDIKKERMLGEQIRALEVEAEPTRDLWPEIKNEIVKQQQDSSHRNKDNSSKRKLSDTKIYTAGWIPWAIAASLVVSLSSLSVSWRQLEKAEVLLAQIDQQENLQLNPNEAREYAGENLESAVMKNASLTNENQQVAFLQSQVGLMEQEFKLARAGLMSRISMNRSKIDKALLKDIQERLTEVEKAVLVLKKGIVEQPDNLVLAELLKRTYQQELTVLTQLAKLDNTI
jgi:hypothetical protein